METKGKWVNGERELDAQTEQKSTEVFFIHLSFKTLNARMRHDEYEIPNVERENRPNYNEEQQQHQKRWMEEKLSRPLLAFDLKAHK